jgi:hypothetical protein
MDNQISDIVVSNSVQNHWLPGAEILVTSQSITWDSQVTRKILDVKEFGKKQVIISLDAPIPPFTNQGDHLAVEVALLSRNIVVNGGHLELFRTPNLVQNINGIQFMNFEPGDNGSNASVSAPSVYFCSIWYNS